MNGTKINWDASISLKQNEQKTQEKEDGIGRNLQMVKKSGMYRYFKYIVIKLSGLIQEDALKERIHFVFLLGNFGW